MKIALIGYGKMGKTIEGILLQAGSEVILRISSENQKDLTSAHLRQADVAIEFSSPAFAFDNICACLRAGIPVVSGTTGWLERLEEARSLCRSLDGAFLYASNFSIGVQLFFALNRYLAGLMNTQTQYEPSLEEIHHLQKLDAPSGTAITLAEGILAHSARKNHWVNRSAVSETELPIFSKRIENVPGTHHVAWQSAVDRLEISHTAHSREGFAAGAVAAAAWLIGRKGSFEMKDMLGF